MSRDEVGVVAAGVEERFASGLGENAGGDEPEDIGAETTVTNLVLQRQVENGWMGLEIESMAKP